MKKYSIGIDEVGRVASKRRASPKTKFIIGIDEVGRGCLAGPVVVCAFAMLKRTNSKLQNTNNKLGRLRDSKKLSALQREEWFAYFKNNKEVFWAIARVNSKTIDKINISRVANRAALLAFRMLSATSDMRHATWEVFLDGGLYLGSKKSQISNIKTQRASTIIRGDEKIPAISAASIVAKVTRDKLMTRLAKKYPEYGFEIHKGYGTKRHYAALKKHGTSEIHRTTFLKN